MIPNKTNYVKKAEEVMKEVKSKENNEDKQLTTSKIRNLLALTADIYNELMFSNVEELNEEKFKFRLNYLKVRFLYESGRSGKYGAVKKFVEKAEILEFLDFMLDDEQVKNLEEIKEWYLLFSRYMEALVAYHMYDGKDQ